MHADTLVTINVCMSTLRQRRAVFRVGSKAGEPFDEAVLHPRFCTKQWGT
jgi:hypothetical protein